MDSDERPDYRRGGDLKLILKAQTQKVIGFAFGKINEIGNGLNGKIYENSTGGWPYSSRTRLLSIGKEDSRFVSEVCSSASLFPISSRSVR
jgi:hypothetical protein